MKTLAISLALFSTSSLANAVLDTQVEHVEVTGNSQVFLQSGTPESILSEQGVEFSAAGGMSALPVMNGMMGDRIGVSIDGATITSACANQMNPPLSYLSANQVTTSSVVAGISPVSMGGDNIAGVITLETMTPMYSDEQSLVWTSGYLGANYQSSNDLASVDGGFSLASDWVSMSYTGSMEDANSYEDGHGDTVYDTLYRAQNHALNFAVKDDVQEFAVKLTHQHIPFQGFPNQYMDMTDNTSYGVTTRYRRTLAASELRVMANWHHVEHEMGFFSDEKTGSMPMNTEADDISVKAQWLKALSATQTLDLGVEYYAYTLEDWWPAVEDSMMMGPNDYKNIHDGERNRLAVYAESEFSPSQQLNVSAGVRIERVTTDTGDVQPYSYMTTIMGSENLDAPAAEEFNSQDHKKDDTLVDATLLVSYDMTPNHSIQLGLARKNRAPNLYERYSWGQGTMATTMIGWFGDGNGYIGDIDLDPETAHTASVNYQYRTDDDAVVMSIKPYYTAVNDYIDAEVSSSFTKYEGAPRHKLQFTNLDATIYGVDVSGQFQLLDASAIGGLSAIVNGSITRGSRDKSDESLYQIMPLQIETKLVQSIGDFTNTLKLAWTDDKTRVDDRRYENTTESYFLVDIESQYQWQGAIIRVSISNLFDEYYQLPLGGVSVADIRMGRSDAYEQLAGQGRSINLGLKFQF
jgi:iron complex outermembrane receptor protein